MRVSLTKGCGIRGIASLLLVIACAAVAQTALANPLVIHVHNVRELYAAVNDPANHDVTVRLAPGTYALTSVYPSGNPRPNQGALRMPPGMSLVGSEKRIDRNGDGVPDPISDAAPDNFTVPGTETVIDGSALDLPVEVRTDCADGTFAAPNGVIHVGVRNTVSHLSVLAGNHVGISEPTNPVDPDGNMSMSVTYTVLEAPVANMTFANCGCASRRARSTLDFSHNVLRGAGFVGLLIQNFLTGDGTDSHSDGPAIWATVTSNLFYNNNGHALQVTGSERGTNGGSVSLYMSDNVFRNNGQNFKGQAGVSHGLTIGNRLTMRSESDTFGEALKNLELIAGPGDTADDPVHEELEAEFLHSRFIRDFVDTPAEISIIGGSGRHNRAQVLIQGAAVRTSEGKPARGGLLIQNQSVPGVGTSKARLEGSRAEFLQSNQGLPAPAARFFLEH